MPLPSPHVWVHHSEVETWGAPAMRAIQNYHMDDREREYNDIAYSFCIDRNGDIYEGRGAGIVGAHTLNNNSNAHGICLFGDLMSHPPTPQQLYALVALLRLGQVSGWWHDLTGGHMEAPGTTPTSCPGSWWEPGGKSAGLINLQVNSTTIDTTGDDMDEPTLRKVLDEYLGHATPPPYEPESNQYILRDLNAKVGVIFDSTNLIPHIQEVVAALNIPAAPSGVPLPADLVNQIAAGIGQRLVNG